MQENKITIIGSGNFGSTIAKIVGENLYLKRKNLYNTNVKQWVFEETINGVKLTDIINKKHENIKYLPNIKLPNNIKATPSLEEAIKDSNVIIFVLPHEFLKKTLLKINTYLTSSQRKNLKVISLIKGISFYNKKIYLMDGLLKKYLRINSSQISVFSGPNIATELAQKSFCYTSIGSLNRNNVLFFKDLFENEYLKIKTEKSIIEIELCGALKNIIALAIGIAKGLKAKNNTIASIITIGLNEIITFSRFIYPNLNKDIFYSFPGIADLIVTCNKGRNQLFAKQFVLQNNTNLKELEKMLFNGQKIQGISTLDQIYYIMKKKKLNNNFPLITNLYKIFFEKKDPKNLFYNL